MSRHDMRDMREIRNDAVREPATAVVVERSPAPRLVRRPLRQRGWIHALLSRASVVVNRALDRIPASRSLYRRCLRRTRFPEIPVAVRGAGPGIHDLRLAFLTDLHAGSFVTERDLLLIFEQVAALAPDVVCFGGDLLNSRPSEIEMLRRPFDLLDPPLGKFAVLGNHDIRWGGDPGRLQDVLEAHGIDVLVNRGVRLSRDGAGLWLCGVDDLHEGRPDLHAALSGRDPGEPTVLLAHQPDQFLQAAGAGVDLTLSGHTHGGQVRVCGWAPIQHSRNGFCAGLFDRGPSRLYVSRGVGATALPVRIGADPEVPLIRFVAER